MNTDNEPKAAESTQTGGKMPDVDRYMLSRDERTVLTEAIGDHENRNKAGKGEYVPGDGSAGSPEQAAIAKRVLQRSEVPSLNQYERASLEKELNSLKESLRKKMVPRRLAYINPKDTSVTPMDRDKAAHMFATNEFHPEYVKSANRYRNISRMLGRSDEESSLEAIRPE